MEVSVSLIISGLGLVCAIVGLWMNHAKFSKGDAVKLEARLTSIENNIKNKLDPIWEVIMSQLPNILISPGTPKIDHLLVKARKDLDSLTTTEVTFLYKALNDKYINNAYPDSGRRLAAALYLVALKQKMGGIQ